MKLAYQTQTLQAAQKMAVSNELTSPCTTLNPSETESIFRNGSLLIAPSSFSSEILAVPIFPQFGHSSSVIHLFLAIGGPAIISSPRR